MPLVKSYRHAAIGCVVNLYDDACQGTPYELQQRKRRLDAAIFQAAAALRQHTAQRRSNPCRTSCPDSGKSKPSGR